MSLQDFVIRREEMTFQGGSLAVRGLSLNDISFLIRDYLTELGRLFDMYEDAEKRETAMAQSAQFAIKIVQEAPEIVAQLIVVASDSPPEAIAVAERMSLPTQVEIIRRIIDLTFEEAGGAKKFIDSLMMMAHNLRPKSATED